jgi:lysophospholipase L1-like esterase
VKVPRKVVLDPILGVRFSPYAPEIDDWGYRNARLPERCDILAIGDSMTYGDAAAAEDAWPQVLERLAGLKVYNAGIGGYAPVEYQVVLDETLRLQPRAVVLALYLGNDLMETFLTVYLDDRGPRFARLQNQDPGQLAEIRAQANFALLRKTATELRGEAVLAPVASTDHRSELRAWLSAHSSVYGLLREAWHVGADLWRRAKGETAQTVYLESFEESAGRPLRLAWEGDRRFRTVFVNPALDLLSIDLDELRVREGLRITQQILLEMRDRLSHEQVGFVVAVIPTKQMAYSRLMETVGPCDPNMIRYLEAEKRLTVTLMSFLAASGIAHVYVLESLRNMFDQGLPPYHQSEDIHPNTVGYEAIARALLPVAREIAAR